MRELAGWCVPSHYGSVVSERQALHAQAGMVDLSPYLPVDISGAGTPAFLTLLDEDDDRTTALGPARLDVFATGEARLILAPAQADSGIAWLRELARRLPGGNVTLEVRRHLTLLALRGPRLAALLPAVLTEFAPFPTAGAAVRVGESSLHGEACGYLLIAPAREIPARWHALAAQGVMPCGVEAFNGETGPA